MHLCIELVPDAASNLRALPEHTELIKRAPHLFGTNLLEASCECAQAVMLDQVVFSTDSRKIIHLSYLHPFRTETRA